MSFNVDRAENPVSRSCSASSITRSLSAPAAGPLPIPSERLSATCPGSVFRMNHASNYLVLKGTLNQDKEAMLRTIDAAEHDLSRLRPEEWRGL